MSEIKSLKLEDGLDPEIAWADGPTLCFLGVDDVTEMRGMELTDGGNLYVSRWRRDDHPPRRQVRVALLPQPQRGGWRARDNQRRGGALAR